MNCAGQRLTCSGTVFTSLGRRRGTSSIVLLYFFHGRNIAILAHGLTKEDRVPPMDIERAIKRKKLFEANPKAHTYESD